MAWIDDFEGNKLSRKWVATRYSQGGQNDGQWLREVKDSKLYWSLVNGNTEGGYWGNVISLPVNAVGDIIIEAMVRRKHTPQFGFIQIGVNNPSPPVNNNVRYGVALAGAGQQVSGTNNYGLTAFPGFPAKNNILLNQTDSLSKMRIVRKNGYLFLYDYGIYVGSYAYNVTIQSVDIFVGWFMNNPVSDYWVNYVKVWPESVVL
jgi:hypothetical protein